MLVPVNVDVDQSCGSHGVAAKKDHVYCSYYGDHEDVEDYEVDYGNADEDLRRSRRIQLEKDG